MEEKFATLPTGRIRYFESGEGRPLLFVHGNTGSAAWYSRAMDLPGFRTIALDLPNFGGSEPLEGEVDLDRYADALAAFAAALALERPILVGHSLGGAVAISAAVRNPGLFRGLVLVDSASPSGLVTPEARHPLIEMMRTNREILAKALATVVPTLKDPAFFETLVAEAARMAAPAWIGNARALGRFDYRGRCGAFRAPVLVLWGRLDPIVTEAMARETAEAFPAARLEILEGVGHSVMAENPVLFKELVAGFAAELR
ncbi:MAG: alpha/beta hydrolase [Spirochaetaceae bacterium]|nr:alpha/beta hydrolase [Spirochaetaceae bacterium]